MEKWKPIKGYEDRYAVSNLGRVKVVGCKYPSLIGRILGTGKNTKGYLHVNLSLNGIKTTVDVHALVAREFIGERPVDYDINHKDENKSNNTQTNLEYVTKSNNNFHSRAKLARKGNLNPMSKLTWDKVYQIRNSKSDTPTLSREFGISKDTVYSVLSNRTWISK